MSSIKFAFNYVITVIFWLDRNCDIIENRDVLMIIIVMLKFTQSLRPNIHTYIHTTYTLVLYQLIGSQSVIADYWEILWESVSENFRGAISAY